MYSPCGNCSFRFWNPSWASPNALHSDKHDGCLYYCCKLYLTLCDLPSVLLLLELYYIHITTFWGIYTESYVLI